MDPILNLGLVSQDEVARVLRDEAGFSAAMVKQEIDRYTQRNSGQAGSCLCGYIRLLPLRTETKLALWPRFDRVKSNDFVPGQGLLPAGPLSQHLKYAWQCLYRHLIDLFLNPKCSHPCCKLNSLRHIKTNLINQ